MTKCLLVRGGARAAVALAAALVLAACGNATADGPATATLAGSEAAETETPQIAPDGVAETTGGGAPWDAAVTSACDAALAPRLTEVAQTRDEGGVTSFWAAGKRWAVCDVAEDHVPVVIESGRGRTGFDERSLAVGSTPLGGGAGGPVRFVAGGLLPWRVQELTYSFPDGHLEHARFVVEEPDTGRTWWVVTYTATEGPLVDAGTDPADLEPATISVVGPAAEAFRVPWKDLQRSE